MMNTVLTVVTVGETGISWHVFQKNAHKTQESLISGMSDILCEKVDIYMLPIQGIKMFRPFTIISKICRQHDHVKRAN